MAIKEEDVQTQDSGRNVRRALHKDVAIVGAVLLVVALVIGIGVVATQKHPDSVAAQLSEWHVKLGATSVAPGRYTFKIHNAGAVEHEFIAFKISSPDAAIPMEGTDVDEDAMQNVTDGPDIAPDGSQTRVVDLRTPGTYIFMCNLAGHYGRGMHQIVTVTK